MKRHTSIYFDYFGYDVSSFIRCEVCGDKAVDLHHIERKGMGGNPSGDKDHISNIIALCRKHHEQMGDKKQYKDYLREVHQRTMNAAKAKNR